MAEESQATETRFDSLFERPTGCFKVVNGELVPDLDDPAMKAREEEKTKKSAGLSGSSGLSGSRPNKQNKPN